MKKALWALSSAVLLLSACDDSQKNNDKNVKLESAPAFDVTSLDKSVEPCDDFYQFTAGGFVENHPIPASESRWGRFNILIENNNAKLKDILMKFSDRDDLEKGSDQQLVGHLFKSGLDSVNIEDRGLTDLQPVLSRIDQVENHNDYLELAGYFKLIGISNPFSVYVSPDEKNVQKNFLYLNQSGLSLPDREYYLKDDEKSIEIQEAFMHYATQLMEAAGTPAQKAEEAAKTVYNFEKKLAKRQMSKVAQRDPENTYNKKEFRAYLNQKPNLEWERYFGALQIATDSLIVSQPAYMTFVDSLLHSTDVETLKTYAYWHTLNAKANYLPAVFEKMKFGFYQTVLRGTKEMKPRWKRVMNRMSGLDEQLGHLFANEHFEESSKARVEQMVEDLREAYRERIKQLDWMTESTKKKAIEKLDAFNYKIGYPDKWSDYSDLIIEPQGYLSNMLRLSKYKTRDNLNRLDQPVDRDRWFMGAHIVNAYYSSSFNEIVFPAGILQPPFFNPDADDAINYGGIGGVIGHEFTHGFDDKGSLYGADGNLNNWWTDKDREKFDVLVDQIIKQYDEFEPLEGLNVNGELTVGENIADLGGITLAYYAYKKSREGKPELEPIDGFTEEQRVFLGWAQVWQTNATAEFIRNRVMTDPHSPARYRVNGPLSNLPEFQEAFNCQPGEGMMRSEENRITIW